MNKEVNIGITIKKIRNEKKMLLKDVAEKANISSSMLSQIEKGNANPSLNTLKTIAYVLEVPLFKFFIEPEHSKEEIIILKKENRKIITTKDVIYEMISPETTTNIEFMKMILTKKNAESSIQPIAHKGEEVALVMKGNVIITLEKASKEMKEGDSIHIPPLKPHKWTNLTNEEAIILFNVTPPEF